MIGSSYIRDACEGDSVVLSLRDFFDFEFHLILQRIVDRVDFQGLVELPSNIRFL